MSSRFTIWKDDAGHNNDRIRANAHAFIDRLPANRSWTIEVKQYVKRRSNDQNAYLWGVCYDTLRRETGNDPEHLHEFFLGEFFGWETIEVMGQDKRAPIRRSSKLSTAEFAEFVAFIQKRAAETVGVYIPDPEPTVPEYARSAE